MTITQVKRQARIGEWVRIIREQQGSGMTVKAWCAAEGYGEGRYYYWLKHVRSAALAHAAQRDQGTSLIRVEPERLASCVCTEAPMWEAAANQRTGMVLRYGNATVELPVGTGVKAIAELLKALNADD